jgi:hypothetical protein
MWGVYEVEMKRLVLFLTPLFFGFNDLAYKWGEVGLNTNKGDCGLNEQTFSVFSGKQYIILQVSAEGLFFHMVKNMS